MAKYYGNLPSSCDLSDAFGPAALIVIIVLSIYAYQKYRITPLKIAGYWKTDKELFIEIRDLGNNRIEIIERNNRYYGTVEGLYDVYVEIPNMKNVNHGEISRDKRSISWRDNTWYRQGVSPYAKM